MVRTYRVAALAVAMALAALQPPAAAAAQAAQPVTIESFAGAWEGSAQTPNGDVSLRAAFKVQDGKLGGTIESSMGQITVVTSTFADGKLTLTIDLQGGAGTLGCQLAGNRIEGIWEYGSDTGPFRLARPGTGDGGSAGDPISGTWAGEVDIAGQIMPFSMDLRVTGARWRAR